MNSLHAGVGNHGRQRWRGAPPQPAAQASRRRWAAVLATVALMASATIPSAAAVPDASAGGSGGGAGRDAAATGYPNDDALRLNEIQVVGTHNSYHLPPHPDFDEAVNELFPGLTQFWQYEHRPLPEQFAEQGVRQIELDVFADPDGGLYANRLSYEHAGLPADPGIPELHEPGMKVLHVQEVDPESTCPTFVICLGHLKGWSLENPGHVPVLVLVELKDAPIPDLLDLGYVDPIPFDADLIDEVDAEILSVFDDEHIIFPDDVRGEHETLSGAITTDGWPTLGEVRGKVMFALDNGGSLQNLYLSGHPSLEGRVMFTGGSSMGAPEAAFMKLNNPTSQFDTIQTAVAAGYVVRTRADGDTSIIDPPDDPEAQRDTALASGAQWVSTDFPEIDERFDDQYFVQMPGGTPGRCNPISAPAWCEPTDVEDPALLAGPPLPECDPERFADVDAASTFCAQITWAVDAGIAHAWPDGTFRPALPVTRQAAAAFLFRLAGQERPEGACDTTGGFSDVAAGHPFCHEIMWLVDAGIAQGWPDGTFRPAGSVTRQAAAVFLFRLAGQERPESACDTTGGFSDVAAGHPFCHEIMWLVGQGVAEGWPDGTFRPAGSVTRQAAAAFLLRYVTR
jgi:hypothetical protein